MISFIPPGKPGRLEYLKSLTKSDLAKYHKLLFHGKEKLTFFRVKQMDRLDLINKIYFKEQNLIHENKSVPTSLPPSKIGRRLRVYKSYEILPEKYRPIKTYTITYDLFKQFVDKKELDKFDILDTINKRGQVKQENLIKVYLRVLAKHHGAHIKSKINEQAKEVFYIVNIDEIKIEGKEKVGKITNKTGNKIKIKRNK